MNRFSYPFLSVDGCVRGKFESALAQLEKALSLALSLGAKRFEAQALQYQAMIAQRRGDRLRALAIAEEGIQVCRQHGMGFTGAWLYGVLGGLLPDSTAREHALAEGEKLLARGCVSHNHFHFYGLAIEACLADSRWSAAEGYCSKLEAYAAAEPLPWTALMVERGQALARFGRGQRGNGIAGALTGLRTRAADAQMNHLLPAIDTALSALA